MWTLQVPKSAESWFKVAFCSEATMEVLDRLVLHDVQRGRMSRHVIDDARTRGSSGRDGDLEHLIVDSAIVRAYQHAAGAKRGLKVRPLAAHARV